MPWVKLTDDWYDDFDLVSAGPLAVMLWPMLITWSARNLTDGRVPQHQVARFVDWNEFGQDPRQAIAALVKQGLLTEDGTAIQIVNYHRYQPSREEVLAERQIKRRRSAMNRDPDLRSALRARDGDRCRYCACDVDWRNRKGPAGGTYDHVIPIAQGGDESEDNLVVCCRGCNSRKGARTPKEAGMILLPVGSRPDIQTESRHPVPVPVPVPEPSSSSSTSDLDSLPAELWTTMADKKAAKATIRSNAAAFKRKCIENDKADPELVTRARWLHERYDLTSSHLADCLIGGTTPRAEYQRKEPA